MKSYKGAFMQSLKIFIIFTILCGFIYTAVVTVIAQVLFPDRANGSLIKEEGKVVGCEYLAQPFTSDKYMWGRVISPSFDTFKDKEGKDLYYAGPSNLSPASKDFEKGVKERAEYLIKANYPTETGKDVKPVPVDLVTNSGSGQDPQISIAAAMYQVPRIAKNNNLTENEIKDLVNKATTGKFLGVLGEKTVNVLKFNLMLDKLVSEK